MNTEEFDKLCNAHRWANAGAKQIQDATGILIEAGFDTQKISLAMIELAEAFKENLQEVAEKAKQEKGSGKK